MPSIDPSAVISSSSISDEASPRLVAAPINAADNAADENTDVDARPRTTAGVPEDAVPSSNDSFSPTAGLPPARSRARTTRALPPGSSELAKRASTTSLAHTLASHQIKNGDCLSVLRMMRAGLLKDLDERGPGGLTLLGQLSEYSDVQAIPSWDEWTTDSKLAWAACLANNKRWSDVSVVGFAAAHEGKSSNILAASLIFAGADPWIGWSRQTKDKDNPAAPMFPVSSMTTADNVLSGAVDAFNFPLARLLLSHPACPSAAEIDRLRVFNVSLPYPGRNSNHHGYYGNSENLPDEPFLHLLAAKNNIAMVKLFLDKGCDVNQVNSSERSPLFYAHTPEMVQLLLEHGASVDLVDEKDNTVDAFWNSYIGTSAARAPVMGLLIKHMATIKTPQELINHQKPSLFATVLSGTKTDFETIFRKSKFSADVTWDRGDRGSWSLLTAALIRRDEKTQLFTNFLAAGKNVAPKNHDILPGVGDRHLAIMTGEQDDFEAANVYPDPGQSPSDLRGVSPIVHQAFRDTLAAAPVLAGTGLDRGAALQFIFSCLLGADVNGSGELTAVDRAKRPRVIGPDGSWLVDKPTYNTPDRNIQDLFAGAFPSGDMGRQFRKILVNLNAPTQMADRDLLYRSAGESFLSVIRAAARRGLRTGSLPRSPLTKTNYISDRDTLIVGMLNKMERGMLDNSVPPMHGAYALIALGCAFAFDVFTSGQVGAIEKEVLRTMREMPEETWSLDVAKTMKDFADVMAMGNTNAAVHGELFGVIASQAERVLLRSLATAAAEAPEASQPAARRRM